MRVEFQPPLLLPLLLLRRSLAFPRPLRALFSVDGFLWRPLDLSRADYITATRTPSRRGVNVSILSPPLSNAPENIFGIKLSRDLLVRVTASDLSATGRQHSPEGCQEVACECHTVSCEVEPWFPGVRDGLRLYEICRVSRLSVSSTFAFMALGYISELPGPRLTRWRVGERCFSRDRLERSLAKVCRLSREIDGKGCNEEERGGCSTGGTRLVDSITTRWVKMICF